MFCALQGVYEVYCSGLKPTYAAFITAGHLNYFSTNLNLNIIQVSWFISFSCTLLKPIQSPLTLSCLFISVFLYLSHSLPFFLSFSFVLSLHLHCRSVQFFHLSIIFIFISSFFTYEILNINCLHFIIIFPSLSLLLSFFPLILFSFL